MNQQWSGGHEKDNEHRFFFERMPFHFSWWTLFRCYLRFGLLPSLYSAMVDPSFIACDDIT